jgi:hypothetical protein
VKLTRTVEENLVVVYTDPSGAEHERDATPDDLERAGFVPLAAFVGPLDLLSPPTLAGALDAIRVRADHRTELGLKIMSLHARAETAERERDRLRDMLTNERDCGQDDVCAKPPGCARHWEARCHELAAGRNEARAEVERLTAPTKGRATDEELVAIGREAYDEGILEGVPHVPWLARIVRAVAARVRQEGIRWAGGVDFAKQEPGLLERLVAKGCDIKVEENPDGSWAVRLRTVTETLTTNAPAADVPATLARLAGLK